MQRSDIALAAGGAKSTTTGLRWPLLALATIVLVAWPLVLRASFLHHIACLVLLYTIGAVSLHLVLRMGLVSLGHASFMGLGGYASALLVQSVGVPFVVGLVCGGLLAAAMALIVGPIILRLKGVYFVLITFTLGEVMRLVFLDWRSLTGGAEGIDKIPPPAPWLNSAETFYYLALLVAAGVCAFAYRLLRSDIGHAIDAIRESDTLAEANGIPVYRVKVLIFAISCGIVGLQGSLQAHFIHYISPQTYAFSESLNFLMMNILGGVNTLAGPIVGALVLVSLPEFLRGWVELQWVIYGLALILIMAYSPGGLAEIGGVLKRHWPSGRGPRA